MAYIEFRKIVHDEDGSVKSGSAAIKETVYDSSRKGRCYHPVREKLGKVPEAIKPAKTVLNMMIKASQLALLTKEETEQVITKIQDFYGRTYDWSVNVSKEAVLKAIKSSGFLLRTKIRVAIEFFDQLYLYGEAGDTQVTELGEERFVEDDTPSVDEILNNKLETE